MRKALLIAVREYKAMVATKAFLLGIAVLPVFMLGGMLVPALLRNRIDSDARRIVVADASGLLLPQLQAAAAQLNQEQAADSAKQDEQAPSIALQVGPAEPLSDAHRLDYSNQIRAGDIYALVEIPPDVMEMDGVPTAVRFYAENPALSETRRWMQRTITALVTAARLVKMDVDPQVVGRAGQVPFESLGLVKLSSSGEIIAAERQNELAAIFLPVGAMMFMFMIIMLSAQPMLESVLEEKTLRIAEVLLSGANPFHVMTGKLLGNVAGSLTVVAIYLSGGVALASYNDQLDRVPLHILPWFIVFQLLAVLLFSSAFMAVGAAVNNLKEAQGLLLPVWLMITLPMFIWLPVVRDATGKFATTASLIPPFVPMLMTIRLATSSAVPMWQPLLGVVILLATTVFCIFAAGRIFRIGILSQGKTPQLTDLARWVLRG